jgi:hypothetical protein
MRLLKTRTKELEFEEFAGRNVPLYAILSHTWGGDEVSLQDVLSGARDMKGRAGYAKIMGTRALAVAHGFDYVWIDTCCIDKTSSAELSEAINSMYRWYQEADICYAYLADVVASPGPPGSGASLPARLGRSRWFTRGWTLQELIAPSAVIFLDAAWREMGTKCGLHEALTQITGIPSDVLQGSSAPSSASVAQRMSWASKRHTTRPEDLAYCLLGLFDVNMPMLYGEGDRAFARLQEEIIKTSDDHSIFAWDAPASDGPLATCPAAFANAGQFLPLESSNPLVDAITVDSKGVHLKVHLRDDPAKTPSSLLRLAVLPCITWANQDFEHNFRAEQYWLGFTVEDVSSGAEAMFERVPGSLRVQSLTDGRLTGNLKVICIRRRRELAPASYYSPLAKAAARGNCAVARLQLAKGTARPDAAMLRVAAENGHTAMVELLLDTMQAEGIETRDVDALGVAAEHGHRALAVALMRRGLQPDAGMLRAAARGGYSGVADVLLEAGLRPDVAMLREAVEQGHEGVARLLMEGDIAPTQRMLHTAAANGHDLVVLLLMKKGLRPSAEMLKKASENGQETVVRLLLESDVRPDTVVLEMAVQNGHEAVVRLLLDKGAKANLNVLLTAVTQGHEEVVKLLLERGVRPNLFILRKVKELGNESVVRLLEESIQSRATANKSKGRA